VTYTPYLDQGLERWLFTTARRNLWRVPQWYSVDDLVQDGYASFYKCAKHYGRLARKRKPKKDDRRNFMALVKRTFENHIHDLSTKSTIQRVEKPVSQLHRPEISADDWLERHASVVEESMADITIVLQQAPREIKQAIAILVGDVVDVKYLRTSKKNTKLVNRETTNEYLCRRLIAFGHNFDPKKVDMIEQVRHYFGVQSTAT